MRVTAGCWGGQILQVPKSETIRPTQDRVREALFSMLQGELQEATFLDLFAGSGSVGIEALSRGARTVTFVEKNRHHAEVLRQNLARLKIVPLPQVLVADVYRWLATYVGDGYSMVFADPPYALGVDRGYAMVLQTLAERGVVRQEGLFIAEMAVMQTAEAISGWDLLRDRTYGKTRLCIWRRVPG